MAHHTFEKTTGSITLDLLGYEGAFEIDVTYIDKNLVSATYKLNVDVYNPVAGPDSGSIQLTTVTE